MALCLGRTLSQSLGGSASLRERLIFGCASKNSPYVAVHIELLQGNQEDYYVTPLRFSNIGIGRKEILILNGTGDDFVISTMHEGSKRFLRMQRELQTSAGAQAAWMQRKVHAGEAGVDLSGDGAVDNRREMGD